MAPASAHDVAAELRKRLPDLPTKKLHKLLYYCQGYHLATFGTPLFHETISAWDMGPVVGTLWKRETEGDVPLDLAELDEASLNTVGYVLSRYGALSGAELERLTHSESPWIEADLRRPARSSARIPVESIHRYFATVSSDADQDGMMPDAEALSSFLEGAEKRLIEDAQVDDVSDLRTRFAVGG